MSDPRDSSGATGGYVLGHSDRELERLSTQARLVDPKTMLRKLANLVRREGVIVFHEPDWDGVRSLPPILTYDRCCRWIVDTMRLRGVDTRPWRARQATVR
jgi:hypothetical protein